MSEVRSTFQLQLGDAAPLFDLPNSLGKAHSLSSLSGANGTLIVFASNHCPFVVHLASTLGQLAKELATQGIHTVAINSNDIELYPQDAPSLMPAFATAHAWDFPYLFDESQSVALAYGAACTPDFFLFDQQLKLFYAGQFDASRPKGNLPPTGLDLNHAAHCLLSQQPPPSAPFPSSGCNIKWKHNQRPSWWANGPSL